MKTMKNYIHLIALSALCCMTACSSEDYTDDPIFDQEIKTELVDKSQLPEWLADYVTYLEYVPEGQELPKEPSGIYRFEWNDMTFYNIYFPNQSTLYTNLYIADGMPVNITTTYTKSFADNAGNWTIVYVLNPTREMPENILYPIKSQNLEYNDSIVQRLLAFKDNPNEFRLWSRDFYAVNSAEQFRLLFGESVTLPAIDFNQHTLIMGTCTVPVGFRQKRQEINTQGETPELKVFFEKAQIFNHEYYNHFESTLVWALYPKLSFDKGKVWMGWNNLEDGAMNIRGGFDQPTDDECAELSLNMYTYNSDYKGYPRITIQIPGDGTIRVKAGSTTFTGKIELSNTRVEEGIYIRGDIKIKLDDVNLSDEMNQDAQTFLKHINEVTHFNYWLNQEMDLLTADGNKFAFF